jgi:extradiol dioxygenase family protein
MTAPTLFHLAIPVNDIAKTKEFYCDRLGATAGRETEKAVILNFYGHQVVAHCTPEPLVPQKGIYPRHFGVVFREEADWLVFCERVAIQGLTFHLPPKLRFAGEMTEHHTAFLADPFHNLLEFKWYRHPDAIFGVKEFAAIGDR